MYNGPERHKSKKKYATRTGFEPVRPKPYDFESYPLTTLAPCLLHIRRKTNYSYISKALSLTRPTPTMHVSTLDSSEQFVIYGIGFRICRIASCEYSIEIIFFLEEDACCCFEERLHPMSKCFALNNFSICSYN
jgi:hypothetical protein